MYKIDYKIFPKNIEELGTTYEYKNSNFNINSIESLENYFKKK